MCMFVSFSFVRDITESRISATSHKKTFTYALQMKLICDHKFTEGTEIRQAATLSWRMCTLALCLPPPPAPTCFQAPVAFSYSTDERDCLGLALMNLHYYY